MRDVALFGERRNNDHWNPSAISKKIEWLDIARIVVASTFVKGDKNRSGLPQIGVALYFIDDLLDEASEEIELGRRGMSINPAAWLYVRDSRKSAVVNILVQVNRVLEMLCAYGGVGHDRRLVLERVANGAILIALWPHLSEIQLVFIV